MSLPKLNTPIYELLLPSTGQTINYRPFLVKEHKVLMTLSEADEKETTRVVKELIRACTFDKIDPNKLPHFDIEYIFMNLRARSIGEIVDVIVNCPCGTQIDASFSINDLKVEKPDGHTNTILLTENIGVEMSYPTFENVLEIYQSNNTEKVIDLIINCIKGIFNKDNYWEAKEQSREELEEFVFSLTKAQFDRLEDFFTTAPKIVQVIESDCPNCGKHNTSRLEGLRNFFV